MVAKRHLIVESYIGPVSSGRLNVIGDSRRCENCCEEKCPMNDSHLGAGEDFPVQGPGEFSCPGQYLRSGMTPRPLVCHDVEKLAQFTPRVKELATVSDESARKQQMTYVRV